MSPGQGIRKAEKILLSTNSFNLHMKNSRRRLVFYTLLFSTWRSLSGLWSPSLFLPITGTLWGRWVGMKEFWKNCDLPKVTEQVSVEEQGIKSSFPDKSLLLLTTTPCWLYRCSHSIWFYVFYCGWLNIPSSPMRTQSSLDHSSLPHLILTKTVQGRLCWVCVCLVQGQPMSFLGSIRIQIWISWILVQYSYLLGLKIFDLIIYK